MPSLRKIIAAAALTIGTTAAIPVITAAAASTTPAVTAAAPAGFGWGAKPADTWT
jgi:hypothetical protein